MNLNRNNRPSTQLAAIAMLWIGLSLAGGCDDATQSTERGAIPSADGKATGANEAADVAPAGALHAGIAVAPTQTAAEALLPGGEVVELGQIPDRFKTEANRGDAHQPGEAALPVDAPIIVRTASETCWADVQGVLIAACRCAATEDPPRRPVGIVVGDGPVLWMPNLSPPGGPPAIPPLTIAIKRGQERELEALVNNVPVELGKLADTLADVSELYPSKETIVILEPAGSVAWRDVSGAVRACRSAGYRAVAFSGEQVARPVDAAPPVVLFNPGSRQPFNPGESAPRAFPYFPSLSPYAPDSPVVPPGPDPAARAFVDELDKVAFFGVEAGGGKRIAFVLGNPSRLGEDFVSMQQELIRSLRSMPGGRRFHVVFFRQGGLSELKLDDEPRMRLADPATVAKAVKWIEGQQLVEPTGRMDPRFALERAFKVDGGPPDVIFFLIDGLIPAETVRSLEELSPDRNTRINTIAFTNRSAEQLLVAIAREHGGAYRFVSERDLKGAD